MYDSLGRFLLKNREYEPADKLFNRWISATGYRAGTKEALTAIEIIKCIQDNNGYSKLAEIYGGSENGRYRNDGNKREESDRK